MAYPIVNRLMNEINASLSAAEAHGMAAGMLCVNANAQSANWLTELLDDANLVSDDRRQILVRLFEETRRLLASDDFEFALFLPDDDTLLSERITALKSWCEGFLFGVGSAKVAAGCNNEVREILKDIAEFTKLDNEAEGEEDENAFVEIVEYLKSAVLLLRDELINSGSDSVH